jgi:uncharacterized protein (DUF736 family)
VVKIAEVMREDEDFVGDVETLGIQLKGVRFKHQDKGANYAIYGPDGVGELGAAWVKTGEFGEYLSVRLDCPTLAAGPINATMKLTPTEDGRYFLRWQRRDAPHGNGAGKHGGGENGAA